MSMRRHTGKWGRSRRSQPCLSPASVLKPRHVLPWRVSMASTAAEYLPILLFLGVAMGLSTSFVVLPMLIAKMTGAQNPYPDKLAEYECGFPAFEDSR